MVGMLRTLKPAAVFFASSTLSLTNLILFVYPPATRSSSGDRSVSVMSARGLLATPLLDWEKSLQKAFDDRPKKER